MAATCGAVNKEGHIVVWKLPRLEINVFNIFKLLQFLACHNHVLYILHILAYMNFFRILLLLEICIVSKVAHIVQILCLFCLLEYIYIYVERERERERSKIIAKNLSRSIYISFLSIEKLQKSLNIDSKFTNYYLLIVVWFNCAFSVV